MSGGSLEPGEYDDFPVAYAAGTEPREEDEFVFDNTFLS